MNIIARACMCVCNKYTVTNLNYLFRRCAFVFVYCAANYSELGTVCEENSTIKQFSPPPPEIWKWFARSTNRKFLECLGVNLKTYLYLYLWQYTRWPVPYYLNLLNQLMAIRSSSGFSHLQPGAFYISFKNTQDTIYTTERVEEKKNKHGLQLAPSTRKKFGHFFCILCFCGCHKCVHENSHTATRNAG